MIWVAKLCCGIACLGGLPLMDVISASLGKQVTLSGRPPSLTPIDWEIITVSALTALMGGMIVTLRLMRAPSYTMHRYTVGIRIGMTICTALSTLLVLRVSRATRPEHPFVLQDLARNPDVVALERNVNIAVCRAYALSVCQTQTTEVAKMAFPLGIRPPTDVSIAALCADFRPPIRAHNGTPERQLCGFCHAIYVDTPVDTVRIQ